ncbi:quinone oxidoreductase family protein [Rhizorhabdus argentea]|uniref:quinone oxidoreductase family protein n=1 Tax=Rhizorhabdus argentea TaxID=1387174 RepID=UPI0030EC938E
MSGYRLVAQAFGGPEVIAAVPIDDGPVPPGHVRVRHRAIGVNFIDIYHRTGLYPQPLPAALGVEAVGIIEAIGEGVTALQTGKRVGYALWTPGSYATWQDVPVDRLIALPDDIGDETAAAAILKGLTAHALIAGCAKMKAGQTALVLAAAGGVGRLLVQWLNAIGVKVIAHGGSAEKAALAKQLGAELSLHCGFDVLAAAVRETTDGCGVDAVFDGVGAASWEASLDSLRRRGLMVSFGNASGPVPPTSPLELTRRGSLFLTRPRLFDYIADRAELDAAAGALFAMIAAGKLDIEIGLRLPLRDAAEAQLALETRRTSGSIILIP